LLRSRSEEKFLKFYMVQVVLYNFFLYLHLEEAKRHVVHVIWPTLAIFLHLVEKTNFSLIVVLLFIFLF